MLTLCMSSHDERKRCMLIDSNYPGEKNISIFIASYWGKNYSTVHHKKAFNGSVLESEPPSFFFPLNSFSGVKVIITVDVKCEQMSRRQRKHHIEFLAIMWQGVCAYLRGINYGMNCMSAGSLLFPALPSTHLIGPWREGGGGRQASGSSDR